MTWAELDKQVLKHRTTLVLKDGAKFEGMVVEIRPELLVSWAKRRSDRTRFQTYPEVPRTLVSGFVMERRGWKGRTFGVIAGLVAGGVIGNKAGNTIGGPDFEGLGKALAVTGTVFVGTAIMGYFVGREIVRRPKTIYLLVP